MSKKYVMWGSYCADVLEKRTPFRQVHLDNLQNLHKSGSILTIGPTQDLQKVFAVYVGESIEEVKSLIEADVYWQNQIWVDYEVHEWIQVF